METTFGVNDLLQIDSGQVMRCLTLANVLRARSTKCYLFRRRHPGHHLKLIRQRGVCHYSFSGSACATTHQYASRQCAVVTIST